MLDNKDLRKVTGNLDEACNQFIELYGDYCNEHNTEIPHFEEILQTIEILQEEITEAQEIEEWI